MMFAAGCMLVFTILSGKRTSELGATPIEHFSNAPLQTCSAIWFMFAARSEGSPRSIGCGSSKEKQERANSPLSGWLRARRRARGFLLNYINGGKKNGLRHDDITGEECTQ